MQVSRRSFLKYCTAVSTALGLTPLDLIQIKEALASPTAPKVIWLQGSGCTGCTISFLNYVSATAPRSAADVLIANINLLHHPNLTASAGSTVVKTIRDAINQGNFILIVEGGIPTQFGGNACIAWTENGKEKTFQDAVKELSAKAIKIICVGNCAAWGGMSASGGNPTGVKGVKAVTGKTTINIAGCPPHPDWIVGTIVQLLQGKAVALDSYGRPKSLFGKKIHEICPLKEREDAKTFGVAGRCLEELGCRGQSTFANCPTLKWNNGVNWCIGANAPCMGCTDPTFPGTEAFFKKGD